jgi:hypothetical protein
MKKLIWKIVLPLSLILISTITMWRYVLIVDGVDEILTGFPVPYICPGWHTSLSYQIFISEFIIDFFIYFAFSFLIVLLVNRFIWKIRTSKKIIITLYIISGILIADPIFLLGLSDHIYRFKSDFDSKTLESGIKFRHSGFERPDLEKYVLIQQDYYKRLDNSWDSIVDKENIQVKFVKQADNKYLGFSPTKRIEDVNFIDSVLVLNEMESDRLFQIISDSTNFDKNKCGLDIYFVHSGFIFSTNDTLYGAVHITYGMDCIEFTPDLNSSISWTLNEKGKGEMVDLIKEIDKQRPPNTLGIKAQLSSKKK